MSRPAMIPNNANYHGLQHEPANRDDLREWRRMDNAGSTRTEDSMKTDTGAGTDLVIHAEHGLLHSTLPVLTAQSQAIA